MIVTKWIARIDRATDDKLLIGCATFRKTPKQLRLLVCRSEIAFRYCKIFPINTDRLHDSREEALQHLAGSLKYELEELKKTRASVEARLQTVEGAIRAEADR